MFPTSELLLHTVMSILGHRLINLNMLVGSRSETYPHCREQDDPEHRRWTKSIYSPISLGVDFSAISQPETKEELEDTAKLLY